MQAWQDFIQRQEGRLGKDAVLKWLQPLKVADFDSGNLYLQAADSFQVLWFEEHIRPQLKAGFVNSNFRPIKVHLSLSESEAPAKHSKPSKQQKQELVPQMHFFKDALDPAMTLKTFIVTNSNQVAIDLLSELADSRISLASFNPIYLWGTGGSGKTHLLVALAHIFEQRGLKALYARAETFTEHVVAAIRSSQMQAFRKAYRNADVLLVDDVHLFARKDATQEEFFHTFNTLHSSNRQIILASNCSPAHLEEIEPRLISRFEWGINIQIKKLERQDLRKLVDYRCENLHFPLSEAVVNDLIQTFPNSCALHKAIEALVLRCHLGNGSKGESHSLDVDSVRKMLSDLIAQEQRVFLSPERIIAAVAAAHGVRSEDLLGKSQNHEYCFPRQIAMFLCRLELKLPYQSIGRVFSRDHSTVMTSIKQIEQKNKAADKELMARLSEIQKKLNSKNPV